VYKDGVEVMFKTGAKAGQVKTKQTKLSECCDGFGVPIVPAWKLAKEGFFSTADENLVELLADSSVPTTAREFITLLLEYRSLSKDIATYYEGYAKLVWPTDGCIHPSINHTLVATGRLSCSKPNLQNCSREDT
jgi:DNA polymerase I-like protein with 3'-5' exonuclease and polymerase domains